VSEDRDYADCLDELRQQAAEWADLGCIHTADTLRRAAFELEHLRQVKEVLPTLYNALTTARVALLNGAATNSQMQVVEDALAAAEQVEA
jgi:hypothetical protein